MSKDLDISVLIPTYNRAEILRETLEAMCQVKRDGLSVEFVVIDNNSTDHTKEVVESFADRLPLCYLFEPRPGKNCALNKALDEAPLGRIVVFADDDVSPYENWLGEIWQACVRWPAVCVFGGRLEAKWPGGNPKWVERRWGSVLSLGSHDPSRGEGEFLCKEVASGANMWIRRCVFDGGRRFDERFGPRGERRISGSETSLQIVLRRDGHKIMYIPNAAVRHRPEPWLKGHRAILGRAWSYGRGGPLKRGIPHMELFHKSPSMWYIHRALALACAVCRLMLACANLDRQKRIGKSIGPAYDIAYSVEAIRLAKRNGGKPVI